MEGATGGQNIAMNPNITINATSSEPEAIAGKVRGAMRTSTRDFSLWVRERAQTSSASAMSDDLAPRYDDSSGWSAMAKAACWLESVAGSTVEFIGRNALDRYSTRTLKASGKFLAYQVLIDGGWLWISATPMNSGTTEKRTK